MRRVKLWRAIRASRCCRLHKLHYRRPVLSRKSLFPINDFISWELLKYFKTGRIPSLPLRRDGSTSGQVISASPFFSLSFSRWRHAGSLDCVRYESTHTDPLRSGEQSLASESLCSRADFVDHGSERIAYELHRLHVFEWQSEWRGPKGQLEHPEFREDRRRCNRHADTEFDEYRNGYREHFADPNFG